MEDASTHHEWGGLKRNWNVVSFDQFFTVTLDSNTERKFQREYNSQRATHENVVMAAKAFGRQGGLLALYFQEYTFEYLSENAEDWNIVTSGDSGWTIPYFHSAIRRDRKAGHRTGFSGNAQWQVQYCQPRRWDLWPNHGYHPICRSVCKVCI